MQLISHQIDISASHVGSVPKKILEAMNVPGLTRENVASHLQAGSSIFNSYSLGFYKVFINLQCRNIGSS